MVAGLISTDWQFTHKGSRSNAMSTNTVRPLDQTAVGQFADSHFTLVEAHPTLPIAKSTFEQTTHSEESKCKRFRITCQNV